MVSVPELIHKRKIYYCEWCKVRPATQRHHALIRRDKRFPELDDERNLMLVCAYCHQLGEVDSKDARRWFWVRQVERYGYLTMEDWIANLPFKVRHFEFKCERLPGDRVDGARRRERTGAKTLAA